jgi:VanZ family protein
LREVSADSVRRGDIPFATFNGATAMNAGTPLGLRLLRAVTIAYWLFLSALLLVPRPEVLVLLDKRPDFPHVHFCCFTLLAILVHASRFSWRMAVAVAVLVAYGLTMETLQYFVPLRHGMQLADYAENVLGVAMGTALWWAAEKIRNRR